MIKFLNLESCVILNAARLESAVIYILIVDV